MRQSLQILWLISGALLFLAAPPVCAVTATGGTTTTNNGFLIHTFTNNGTFEVSVGGTVELLVVGGGGGGGGGAGGYLYTNSYPVAGGSNYSITIGAGGAGGAGTSQRGFNGGNSVFGTLTAVGGGGGGYNQAAGLSGGSGGGGGGNGAGGAGTSGQGFAGGGGSAWGGNYPMSGGGGASTSGADTVSNTTPTPGGDGKSNAISGAWAWYAGGGGGGVFQTAAGAAGGVGGGGHGGGAGQAGMTSGQAKTGSGGGGSGGNGAGAAGSGGSGIVIVRYAPPLLLYGMSVTNVTTTAAMAAVFLVGTNADIYLFWDATDKGTDTAAWGSANLVGVNMSTGMVAGAVLSNLTAGAGYACRFLGTNTANGQYVWSAPFTFITGAITITATVATVSVAGTGSGMFTVYRPEALTNLPLSVNVSVGGTAINGTDCQLLSGTITIPAGTNSTTIAVLPLDRTRVGHRTVILTIATGGYLIGSPGNATVTIVDDDAPENYAYRSRISFNGYTRTEVLTNFPALVVLATNIVTNFVYSQTLSTNGYDVRFFNADVTARLNFEIEKWDTTSNSFIWVQVPLLTNNAAIWAYWGNAAATSAPAACTTNGATWDAGFKGVWHLRENPAGSDPQMRDSTTNLNHGSCSNMVAGDQTGGIIDGAVTLDGAWKYVNCGNAVSLQNGSGTLEAWIRTSAYDVVYRAILCKQNAYGMFTVNQKLVLYDWTPPIVRDTGFVIADGALHHVACAYQSGIANGTAVYVDGIKRLDCQITIKDQTVPEFIGYGYSAGQFHSGPIDEARASSVVRSSNWIWAVWMNVASNRTFARYEAAVARPVTRASAVFFR